MFGLDTILIIMVVAGFLYQPLQTYFIDVFKQHLFNIRSELFLNYDTGDPLIVELREVLDSQIRFLHKMSIWRVLLIKKTVPDIDAQANDLIKRVENHERASELSGLLRRTALMIALFIFIRSPFMWLVLLLAVLPITVYKAYKVAGSGMYYEVEGIVRLCTNGRNILLSAPGNFKIADT